MSDEIEVKQEDMPVSEAIDTAYEHVWENPEATTFAQLEAVDTVGDLCDDIGTLSMVYRVLVGHIRDNATVTDKLAAVKTVTDEYTTRLNGLIGEYNSTKSLFTKAVELFKEAPFKTEMGKKFHASDYAYVPDSKKPSTWKLRLTESPGASPTKAQLGRAAAAFSSGGFRGNRVQLPGKSVGSAKAKIRSAYHKLGVKDDEIPASVKESGMTIWKENGQFRIVASYTNSYRDDDSTPEIISSESQKGFVDRVDAGELPMPVFLHWHLKGTEYAVADWLNFDDENLVTTAVGHVLPGHEQEAEILASRSDIRTSHGMPIKSIVRDETDNTIIKQHVTVEISDLPSWAAANQLSNFVILKEEVMAIPDVKKQYLRDLGLSDEKIDEIEKMNSQVKTTAEEQHRESKEKEAAPAQEVKPAPEAAPVPVTKETPPAAPAVEPLTPEVVAKAVAEAMAPIMAGIKALTERVEAVETKSKEQRVPDLTPTASLAALIAQNMSAIGAKETTVRKGTPLANAAPETTPVEEQKAFEMPAAPLIGDVINSIITRKNGKS